MNNPVALITGRGFRLAAHLDPDRKGAGKYPPGKNQALEQPAPAQDFAAQRVQCQKPQGAAQTSSVG